VNVHASALRLKEAIASDPKTATSPLVVVEDAPDFTAADLEQIRQPVVTYTTRFNPGDVSRTHNLRLVASRLNGALIPPGGTFSFNGWVGERRPEEGFREAIVYKQGKMVKDTAGGLCQVSSTLYNVALLAGLPIVERSNHSLTVTYVPLGRDATVYWGQRDLRFRNDTDTPLYIRARTGRRTLTIEAWGAAPLKRKVTVTSSASRRGGAAFAQVYRTVVENGTKTRSRISSDMYSTVHSMADRPVRSSRRSRD
jgi:vancomycin resistance protein YoaR